MNACGCSRGVKTGQFPNSSLVPVPVQRLQQSCLATLNSAIRFSQSRFAAITYCKEVLGGRPSKKLARHIGSEGTKKDLSFRNCHGFFFKLRHQKKEKEKEKKNVEVNTSKQKLIFGPSSGHARSTRFLAAARVSSPPDSPLLLPHPVGTLVTLFPQSSSYLTRP